MRRTLNSSKLNRASILAVAASVTMILVSADGSGAVAQARMPAAIQEPTPAPAVPALADSVEATSVAVPVVQPLPQTEVVRETADQPAETAKAVSLAAMVARQPQPAELARELNCLAGAIYFESKGETLAGQLAVGRVIVARSKSGRFPDSYCGVVYQRSQFSFVRGNSMPAIPKASRHWKNAVAIAQIAHENSWKSPVEGALFFHAAYVSPNWRLKRMARIDNHVFYR